MGRGVIRSALLLIGSILLVACPNPLSKFDLREQIANEVDIATAPTRRLTVESSPYGVATVSGTVEVKDGFPVSLGITAFPTYGMIGWEQTEGPGIAAFASSDNSVEVTVTGGDVTVAPILVERPKVLYSMPIGNNTARNVNVAVAFSAAIDFDTITEQSFRVQRGGYETPLVGQYFISADRKTIGFNPDEDLNPYSNYVISIESSVGGYLNVDAYDGVNCIILDDSLLLASSYTAAFMTGLDMDSTPPANGTFNVVGTNNDPYYTRNGSVLLTGISAEDPGGVAWVRVKNKDDIEYQSFSYEGSPEIKWAVPFAPGSQEIDMAFEDWNGNRTPDGFEVKRSIIVDTDPPTGGIAIDGDPDAPSYVAGTTVDLALTAADPDVVPNATAPPGIRGSGASVDGSDATAENRNLMRLANSPLQLPRVAWEPFSGTKAGWELASSTEGIKSVYAQFRDPVGNVSFAYVGQIYLDVTAPDGTVVILDDGTATNSADGTVTLAVLVGDGEGSGVDLLAIAAGSDLEVGSAWSTPSTPGGGTIQADGSSDVEFTFDEQLSVQLSAGDGPKVVYLEVTDKVGNSRVVSQTITVDRVDPSGGSISINNGVAATNSADVTIYVTAPVADGGSPITYMGFSNDSGAPPTTWVPVTTTAPWTLDSATAGSKTVYAWFRDAAGNSSPTYNASDAIDLDISPPSGTITISPNPTRYSTVTVYCNVTDAVEMEFSNNNSAWSPREAYQASKAGWDLSNAAYGGSGTNGNRTVYARFYDAADNMLPVSNSVLFDSGAPTVSSFVVNSNDTATNSGTVTLSVSATDNVYAPSQLQMRFSNNNAAWSGWQTYATSKSWSMTSSTYGGTTAQGWKYVYIQVKDPAGNVTATYDAIYYDITAPTISSVSVNSGATYTNYAYVTVSIGASDASPASGLDQMRFSNNGSAWSGWESYGASRANWLLTNTSYGGTTVDGSKYVYVQIRDKAGNLSSAVADGIVYDTTPPSGTFTIESGNPATTSFTDAYLYFSVTDNLSGVVERRMYNSGDSSWSAWETYTTSRTSPAWYLRPLNGVKTVYAQFKDGAGNISNSVYDQVTLAESYGSLVRNDIAYFGNSYMSTASISGNDPFSSSSLKVGSVLVYYTNLGRYGKLWVKSFNPTGNVLTIDMTTYNSDGTVYVQKTNLQIRGTYSCDLDTGVETSTGRDFWWEILSSTSRRLTPTNSAKFAKWQ